LIGPGNSLAFLTLILWIPISLVLFSVQGASRATAMVLLGAMLLLPVGVAFDFPMLPALDKELIANLCALAGFLVFARIKLRGARIGRGIDILVLMVMAGCVITAFVNRDPLSYGATVLPAMGPWDAISDSVFQLLNIGIPFFLGRVLFRRPSDLRFLLTLLAGAALVYAVLILYEIRMSPQLHRMIYGYFQHAFYQTIRSSGGYRPMVFMTSGLPLSMFVLVAAISATALAKVRQGIGPLPAIAAAVFLSVLLLLCQSMASIAYGVFLIPLVALAKPRLQINVAVLLAVLVFAYPLMRALHIFPTTTLVSQAAKLDEVRARSLDFRFEHEDQLLDKAIQRPWFGWGGYNRSHVYREITGEDVSITDGFWIIQLGLSGVVGFVGTFGILLVPIFLARRRFVWIRSAVHRQMVACLALIVAIYAVDLLPNGFFNSFTVFLSGALTGVVRGPRAREHSRRPKTASRAAALAVEKDGGGAPPTQEDRSKPGSSLPGAAGDPPAQASLGRSLTQERSGRR
jgi:hypothetical protein